MCATQRNKKGKKKGRCIGKGSHEVPIVNYWFFQLVFLSFALICFCFCSDLLWSEWSNRKEMDAERL